MRDGITRDTLRPDRVIVTGSPGAPHPNTRST